MDNPCHRCAPAVVDIGHRSGNGACSRDPTEERSYDIGHSLCNQFHV
ncbi:hypothetical protein SDC9_128478 [bioreactor metagenome]|uniref:Uncharacterized protein n=1 Tax=bioreactor metagenome TaxID=1076179 RepID=A0A645CX43_9ZZZZ